MSLSKYYTEICKEPILKKEEEFELFVKLHDENISEIDKQEIRDKIIKANLRFVFKTAKRYSKGDPTTLEELISAGNEGLLVGLEKYNPSRDVRFLSYAGWWVVQRILNQMSKMRIVALPIWKQQLSTRIIKAREATEGDLSLDEIKEQFPEVSNKDLEELYDTRYLTYYIEDMKDDNEFNVDPIGDQVERSLDNKTLRDTVSNLSYPYNEVLALSFGLFDDTPRSDAFIAKKLKIPKEDIEGLKEEALGLMRENLDG